MCVKITLKIRQSSPKESPTCLPAVVQPKATEQRTLIIAMATRSTDQRVSFSYPGVGGDASLGISMDMATFSWIRQQPKRRNVNRVSDITESDWVK